MKSSEKSRSKGVLGIWPSELRLSFLFVSFPLRSSTVTPTPSLRSSPSPTPSGLRHLTRWLPSSLVDWLQLSDRLPPPPSSASPPPPSLELLSSQDRAQPSPRSPPSLGPLKSPPSLPRSDLEGLLPRPLRRAARRQRRKSSGQRGSCQS